MTYFDQIEPINDIFPKFLSIKLISLKEFFETYSEKIIWPLSQNFEIWRHFGPQNDSISIIFTKNTY